MDRRSSFFHRPESPWRLVPRVLTAAAALLGVVLVFGLLALAYYLVLVGAGFFNFAIGPYAMMGGLCTSWLVIQQDLGVLAAAGIALRYADYSGLPEYPQLHPPFEPQVSIIDLIFMCGPEAARNFR